MFQEGAFVSGKLVNGDEVMEGAFDARTGKPSGQCVATLANGVVIDGEWRAGKPWDAAIRGADGQAMGGFEQGKQVRPKAAP